MDREAEVLSLLKEIGEQLRILANGQTVINERLSRLEQGQDNITQSILGVIQAVNGMNKRLAAIERTMSGITKMGDMVDEMHTAMIDHGWISPVEQVK